MKTKLLLLISLLTTSFFATSCGKKIYKEGDPLVITSIEMADEYGESTLIQHNGFDILVDSGSELDANHVKEVLNAKVSDKTIDLLVVTHPHGDHIGGIINDALSDMTIKQIVDYGYTYVTDGHDKITNNEYVQAYINKRNQFISSGAKYHGIVEQMNESKVIDLSKNDDLNQKKKKNDNYLRNMHKKLRICAFFA